MSVTNETVTAGPSQEPDRRKSRRRSSLSAKRFSLVNPFAEPSTEQSQVEDSRLSQGSASEHVSEAKKQEDDCRDEDEEDYWGYRKEIDSLSQESASWETFLQESENRQADSQERLSNQQPLRITDLPVEVQREAKTLIGTQPDYSCVLEQTQNMANKAFLQIDELASLALLCQSCEQTMDRRLTGFAERLGECSFDDFNTPRTLIRHRLDSATPRK